MSSELLYTSAPKGLRQGKPRFLHGHLIFGNAQQSRHETRVLVGLSTNVCAGEPRGESESSGPTHT